MNPSWSNIELESVYAETTESRDRPFDETRNSNAVIRLGRTVWRRICGCVTRGSYNVADAEQHGETKEKEKHTTLGGASEDKTTENEDFNSETAAGEQQKARFFKCDYQKIHQAFNRPNDTTTTAENCTGPSVEDPEIDVNFKPTAGDPGKTDSDHHYTDVVLVKNDVAAHEIKYVVNTDGDHHDDVACTDKSEDGAVDDAGKTNSYHHDTDVVLVKTDVAAHEIQYVASTNDDYRDDSTGKSEDGAVDDAGKSDSDHHYTNVLLVENSVVTFVVEFVRNTDGDHRDVDNVMSDGASSDDFEIDGVRYAGSIEVEHGHPDAFVNFLTDDEVDNEADKSEIDFNDNDDVASADESENGALKIDGDHRDVDAGPADRSEIDINDDAGNESHIEIRGNVVLADDDGKKDDSETGSPII